jgi:ATP-dependent Lon protease
VRQFKGQYPVPTYVAEFLLGRYCASVDEAEIQEGLAVVQRQLASRTVRAGEEELFKARAKGQGRVKLIDLIKARLDAKNDCFVAELPSVRLNDVRISDALVHTHDRMLTGGFYAEIDLTYDPSIAEEESGRPFGIESLREIQLSKSDVMDALCKGRALFTFTEWRDLLIRSIGLEPSVLGDRTCDVMLLRMIPFVENNYNAVELGPRGTGKSHLCQVVKPQWRRCSSTTPTVNVVLFANTT